MIVMEISKSNWTKIRRLLSGYAELMELHGVKPHERDKGRQCRVVIRDIERNELRKTKRLIQNDNLKQ